MSTEKQTAEKKFVRDYALDLYKGPEGSKELIIRTWDINELAVEEPKKVSLKGTIAAPFEYYKKRITDNHLHDPNKCYLTINRDKKTIVLRMDEKFDSGTVVTGGLIPDTDLEAFGINKGKMWTVRDLQNHIKMNRALFTSSEECMKLVKNLGNFSAKIEVDIQKAEDKRGNTLDSIATKLTTEIPLNFFIESRIFKGQDPIKFPAEICINASTSGVQFWLESVELREIQMKETDRIFNLEIEKFNDEIVTIEE